MPRRRPAPQPDDIAPIERRRLRLDRAAAAAGGDARKLRLICEDLAALIAELDRRRANLDAAAAAADVGRTASLAYLAVGRAIAACRPAPAPSEDRDHAHSRPRR